MKVEVQQQLKNSVGTLDDPKVVLKGELERNTNPSITGFHKAHRANNSSIAQSDEPDTALLRYSQARQSSSPQVERFPTSKPIGQKVKFKIEDQAVSTQLQSQHDVVQISERDPNK